MKKILLFTSLLSILIATGAFAYDFSEEAALTTGAQNLKYDFSKEARLTDLDTGLETTNFSAATIEQALDKLAGRQESNPAPIDNRSFEQLLAGGKFNIGHAAGLTILAMDSTACTRDRVALLHSALNYADDAIGEVQKAQIHARLTNTLSRMGDTHREQNAKTDVSKYENFRKALQEQFDIELECSSSGRK